MLNNSANIFSKEVFMRYSLLVVFVMVQTIIGGMEPIQIDTIYGSTIITEPVLIELINRSEAIKRLKYVNQYGVMKFIKPEDEYTRFQHSLGVLYLLRRFGASLAEQVMGLLHDVSHTAFSHIADYI